MGLSRKWVVMMATVAMMVSVPAQANPGDKDEQRNDVTAAGSVDCDRGEGYCHNEVNGTLFPEDRVRMVKFVDDLTNTRGAAPALESSQTGK